MNPDVGSEINSAVKNSRNMVGRKRIVYNYGEQCIASHFVYKARRRSENAMKNFVPAVRTDRFREMKMYADKGYSFIIKRDYRKVDKIFVENNGKEYTFGIEVTQNEIYFYIVNDLANAYLTLVDIYVILAEIAKAEGTGTVVKVLKKQLRCKETDSFYYQGIEYKMRRTAAWSSKEVRISQTGLYLTYQQILMLVNLIQEKSNSFFQRSKAYKSYKDGILRLLIALLSCEEDCVLLSHLGWRYSGEEQRFRLQIQEETDERSKMKYYLTRMEYKNIMR